MFPLVRDGLTFILKCRTVFLKNIEQHCNALCACQEEWSLGTVCKRASRERAMNFKRSHLVSAIPTPPPSFKGDQHLGIGAKCPFACCRHYLGVQQDCVPLPEADLEHQIYGNDKTGIWYMDQIWSEATDDIKKDRPPPPKQTKKTQKDNNSPHESSWPGSRIEPPPPRLRSLRFDEFRFCHFIEEEAGFARKWSVLFSFLLLTRLLLWSPFQSCLFFQISSTPCDPPLQDSDVKLIKFKCINLKLHEASSCCVPTSHVECSIVKTQSIGVSPPL